MAKASGFGLQLSAEGEEIFRDLLDEGKRYSEAVPDFARKRGQRPFLWNWQAKPFQRESDIVKKGSGSIIS